MLHHLITSKTRLRLMLKLFLDPGTEGYLRSLTREFSDSTNAVRVELNRFANQDMIISRMEKNLKIYRANEEHPYFFDIRDLVRRYMQWDKLVENIDLERVKNIFVIEEKSTQQFYRYVIETVDGQNCEKTVAGSLQVLLKERREINRMLHSNKPFIQVWNNRAWHAPVFVESECSK